MGDDEEAAYLVEAPPTGKTTMRPQHRVASVGPIVVVLLAGSYYFWHQMRWPKDCWCLDSRFYYCFGWWEKFDTKFSPLSALMIYSVTTLDVVAQGNDYGAALPRVGRVGASVWW